MPINPKFAISLMALETYRVMRNRKPSFSIQAFARALCDLHLQPYRPIYRRQISEAFDVYLRILRLVDARVAKALGREHTDWRLLHSCPPCQYKLKDEPALPHDLLLTIDGGSSLKRFATAGSKDAPPPSTATTSYPHPKSTNFRTKSSTAPRSPKHGPPRRNPLLPRKAT